MWAGATPAFHNQKSAEGQKLFFTIGSLESYFSGESLLQPGNRKRKAD